jgi:hypothetical protein
VDVLFKNSTSTLLAVSGTNIDNDNDVADISWNMGGIPISLVTSKQQEANKLQIGLFEAATKYDKLNGLKVGTLNSRTIHNRVTRGIT